MTTELATIDGEVIEESQPVTLYGTTDPAAIVERASTLATALADVINRKHLFKQISGRNHVLVEGWTLLGSMLGVFAEVEWTRATENGWEARAVARTLNGRTVGAAEAMCSRSERTWNSRDDYALRSMAQTRAVSKALRLPLGYIIELAGYSATPADEIPDEHHPAPPSARARLAAVASEHNISADDLGRYADKVGIEKGVAGTDEQIEQIIALIEQPAQEPDAALGSDPVPATTPQESVSESADGQDPPVPPAATDPAVEAGTPQSEVPAADEASTAEPTLEEVLAVSGGTLEPEKPEYVKRAEARAAAAKAAPKGARETPEPEPISAGLA